MQDERHLVTVVSITACVAYLVVVLRYPLLRLIQIVSVLGVLLPVWKVFWLGKSGFQRFDKILAGLELRLELSNLVLHHLQLAFEGDLAFLMAVLGSHR